MTQRFYFSRRKDGSYHIIDRYIDLRIAKAEFREAAVQIIAALNNDLARNEASKAKELLPIGQTVRVTIRKPE